MSYAQQRSLIETKFEKAWDSNKTPIRFENVQSLKKGSSSVSDETSLTEWVKLTIEHASATYAAINTKVIRHQGTINVTVFVKAGAAKNRAYELADKVRQVMAPTDADTEIRYYPAAIVASDDTPDKTFFQVVVQVPFLVDQSS